jgi:xanthine dehydrogenase small subunit
MAIRVPFEWGPDELSCHKVTKRFDQDISAVCGCFALRIAGGRVQAARIAFGGMAATPKRARSVETALTGKPWTDATVTAALPEFAADFQPIDDLRASAGYRLTVAQNLLRRVFHERVHGTAATRLAGAALVFAS